MSEVKGEDALAGRGEEGEALELGVVELFEEIEAIGLFTSGDDEGIRFLGEAAAVDVGALIVFKFGKKLSGA